MLRTGGRRGLCELVSNCPSHCESFAMAKMKAAHILWREEVWLRGLCANVPFRARPANAFNEG